MRPNLNGASRVEQAALAFKAARRKRDEEIARRRKQESYCAWRFLHEGEPHKDCAAPHYPCSREYQAGAPPEDVTMYEGTGIGFLYGLDHSDHHAWQTAGWNIKRRRRT